MAVNGVGRHRWGVATVVMAAFAALVAGSALFWHGQRREAAQRARAERNLELALQAMDKVYLQYAEDNWLRFADASQQRPITEEGEKVLKEAMHFYEQFAESNRGELSVVVEIAEAYYRVGEIRDRLGMHQEATEAWAQAESAAVELLRTRAARREPDRLARAYCILAWVSAARGDNLQGIQYFTQAIQLNPEDHEPFQWRGSLYRRSGMPHQAIADETEVIRLQTSRGAEEGLPMAYYERANAYCDKGELDQAIADYNQAIRLLSQGSSRNKSLMYRGRGQAYQHKGDLDQAIADYNQAMRLLSAGPSDDKASVYNDRGTAYYAKREFDRAIADFDEAIRLDPGRASHYRNRGAAYKTKGDLDKALVDFHEAIRLDPQNAVAYNNRGWAYAGKGDFDEAIADYSKAIHLDPQIAVLYNNRGQVYLRKGDFDKAIDDFDEAIRLAPTAVVFYMGRAKTRAKLGQIEDALSDVEKALEVCRKARQRRSLAWFLATCEDPRLRRVDRALELVNQTIKQAPKHAEFWTTLGAAQYRAGNWQAAVDALQKSSELKYYRVARTGFFLAMAHWQLGQKDEARHWYEKAVEWMENNRPWDEELRRFRAEAEELMGVSETHHGDTEGTEKSGKRTHHGDTEHTEKG